jgi:hypothetical protein
MPWPRCKRCRIAASSIARIEDAVDETARPEPDKEEVGGALERAVKYANAAGDFTENAGKLLPPLTALASWLGPVGHGLLSLLGLSA